MRGEMLGGSYFGQSYQTLKQESECCFLRNTRKTECGASMFLNCLPFQKCSSNARKPRSTSTSWTVVGSSFQPVGIDASSGTIVSQTNFFVIIEEMARSNYLGEFELLVMLTVIRLGEEAYGVPIARGIEQQTGRQVAFGTVYATLERLQEKGFVCSTLGDATPERGGRAKRYFRVTSTGLRTVRETKQSLIRLWRGLRELEGGVG